MRVREFANLAAARAAKGDDEVVVGVADRGHVYYGLLPAEVTIDTPMGERSQPIGEFLAGYWHIVDTEAQRRVAG
jgi:hypothetical protein